MVYLLLLIQVSILIYGIISSIKRGVPLIKIIISALIFAGIYATIIHFYAPMDTIHHLYAIASAVVLFIIVPRLGGSSSKKKSIRVQSKLAPAVKVKSVSPEPKIYTQEIIGDKPTKGGPTVKLEKVNGNFSADVYSS